MIIQSFSQGRAVPPIADFASLRQGDRTLTGLVDVNSGDTANEGLWHQWLDSYGPHQGSVLADPTIAREP